MEAKRRQTLLAVPIATKSSPAQFRLCKRTICVELMWLTERLTPDFKKIADFRKDNGPAIRNVCRQFILKT
jgi:hypothetical protein